MQVSTFKTRSPDFKIDRFITISLTHVAYHWENLGTSFEGSQVFASAHAKYGI